MNPLQLADQFRDRGPLLHLVLDGWGVGPPDDTNALHKASLPIFKRITEQYPYTQLWTHGTYVGLPGDMAWRRLPASPQQHEGGRPSQGTKHVLYPAQTGGHVYRALRRNVVNERLGLGDVD
ncbi:MAG: hypothetical protein ACO3S0_05095 [bacterium]